MPDPATGPHWSVVGSVPVASIPAEQAGDHFRVLAAPASNALTRELLGWEPSRPGLLADLDAGRYTRSD
jgi:hypothetical protein